MAAVAIDVLRRVQTRRHALGHQAKQYHSAETSRVKKPDIVFFFQAEDGIRDIGDWSSDVCSSDLWAERSARVTATIHSGVPASRSVLTSTSARSEERRVRKECRSRWSPYH